jgi:hypothetical protein
MGLGARYPLHAVGVILAVRVGAAHGDISVLDASHAVGVIQNVGVAVGPLPGVSLIHGAGVSVTAGASGVWSTTPSHGVGAIPVRGVIDGVAVIHGV